MLPLALQLWPTWVSSRDCDDTYGFVVRYMLDGDLELSEHFDTSNVTLNLCLGKEFEGGQLCFKGVRFTESEGQQDGSVVEQVPGEAVIHLGGHRHAALPILAGVRQNLILWTWGEGGVVRVAPVPPKEHALSH